MTALVAMVALAAVCWLMRAMFIVLVPAERLPQALRDALVHLAPAVLAALVAVEVAGAVHGLRPLGVAVLLASVLLAAVAMRLTGRIELSVAIGLAAAVLLDLALI
jgi:branched-subunit amino acid transport protein